MHLQYISDSNGETTGVFIPIDEWNELKSKFNVTEEGGMDVPEWHKNIVRERMIEYKKHPERGSDFDEAMDDIEKGL